MRLRNVKGSREAIQESIYVVHEEETRAGSWHDIQSVKTLTRLFFYHKSK